MVSAADIDVAARDLLGPMIGRPANGDQWGEASGGKLDTKPWLPWDLNDFSEYDRSNYHILSL